MIGLKSISPSQNMVHQTPLDSYYQASLMTRLGTGNHKVPVKLLIMVQMKCLSWCS